MQAQFNNKYLEIGIQQGFWRMLRTKFTFLPQNSKISKHVILHTLSNFFFMKLGINIFQIECEHNVMRNVSYPFFQWIWQQKLTFFSDERQIIVFLMRSWFNVVSLSCTEAKGHLLHFLSSTMYSSSCYVQTNCCKVFFFEKILSIR